MVDRRRRAPSITAAVLAAGLACGVCATTGCDGDDATPAWLLDPAEPMPLWLSETGIFSDLGALSPGRGFVAYEPPHPLFSNRAGKGRLLWLPPGAAIDTGDPAAWSFPEGTVLVKSFSYRHVEGRLGDVAIETRVLRRGPDGWQYGVYHWAADGGEGRLEAERWPESRFVLEDVNGSDFPYVIPGELDCEACHETHLRAPVIGLGPDNLDPGLVEQHPELFTDPPTPVALPAASAAERKAMSYIVGNCVHCHHGHRGDDNAAFDLRPVSLVDNTVGVPTDSSASGDGVRVVPGDPEGSALFEAVVAARSPGYTGDFKPMPPVGVVMPDHDGAELLRAWIEELGRR